MILLQKIHKRIAVILEPGILVKRHSPFTKGKILITYLLTNIILSVLVYFYNSFSEGAFITDLNRILAMLLDNLLLTLVLSLLALGITFAYIMFAKFSHFKINFSYTVSGYIFVFLLVFFYTRIARLGFLILSQNRVFGYANWLYLDFLLQYLASGWLALYFTALVETKKKLPERMHTFVLLSNLLINFLIIGP